jgi:hypothetical protein
MANSNSSKEKKKPLSEPVQEGVDAYNRVVDILHLLYPFIKEAEARIRKGQLTEGQMADTGYILRQLEKRFDDLRKEAKKGKELSARILAIIAAKRSAESGGEKRISATVHGEISRATPEVKMQAAPPKRGSGAYIAFMTDLGVPKEIIDLGVLDPRWKGVCELATELTRAGKKLPPGLGQTIPEYSATFVRLPDSPIGGGNDSESEDNDE